MIDKLHYISQTPHAGTHLDAIRAVLNSGGKWIQLRIKEQPETEILNLARQVNALCMVYGAKLIVNDYPHIAAAIGAYGVHLGLQDMPIPQARSIVGKRAIIGGTANTFEQVLQRVSDGADYIGLGPYRFTNTKQNLSPVIGLDGYKVLMKNLKAAGINIPIIAIGGITLPDIPILIGTGLHGVALSGELTKEPEQLSKINSLLQ